jgi:predicted RNA-binding protein with PUA-like domain
MHHWLLKTEPEEWSWSMQARAGIAPWNGVRNHQAANFMRQMKTGDLCFFYHTGDERRIVGIVEVVKPFYADTQDPGSKFGVVDVRAVMPLLRPVELSAIRAEEKLEHLLMLRNSRLSVTPIDALAWRLICRMGGVSL